MNIDIESVMNIDNYATEERKSRRKGAKSTQEYFTPYEIVKKMADKVDDEIWADPSKTFVDPAAGNGQFILYIIYKKLTMGVNIVDALNTTFAVELMEDNVKECKQRILNMLDEGGVEYDKTQAVEILDRNIVCHDFFTWDFENWRPNK